MAAADSTMTNVILRAIIGNERQSPDEVPCNGVHGGINHRGTTAVASISTRACGSTSRTIWTSAIAG